MFICVYCVCFVARSDGEQHGFPIFRTGDFGSFVLNWSCIAALCALGGKETPLKPANAMKKMFFLFVFISENILKYKYFNNFKFGIFIFMGIRFSI